MKQPLVHRARAALKRFALGKETGSTLIELGICLPVAMTMTLGFIYMSLLVFGMSNNAYSARAALRYACIHSNTSSNPTTQAALNAIIARFAIPYPSNTTNVFFSYGTLGNAVGQPINIVVTVTYTMSIFGTTYSSPVFTWQCIGYVIE